jgi:hypothetical protein
MVIVKEPRFGDGDIKSVMKQERASVMVNISVDYPRETTVTFRGLAGMKRNEHFSKLPCFRGLGNWRLFLRLLLSRCWLAALLFLRRV